jgi:hypothetical protein
MLDVKVKTKDVRLSIPVPYSILNLGVLILSSNMVNRLANKWTKPHLEKNNISFIIPPIDKKELRKIVNELKQHKGIELVRVNAKDGTEVIIKL